MDNLPNLKLDGLRRATTKESVIKALNDLGYNSIDDKIFALKKASNYSVRYCSTYNPSGIIDENELLNEHINMFLRGRSGI